MKNEIKCPTGYTEGYKKERLSNIPVSLPLGARKPESLHDTISRLIANRFNNLQLDNETETFEEADDFDVDDDFDPSSPWEEVFDKSGNSLGFLDQNKYQNLRKDYHNEKTRYSVPNSGSNNQRSENDMGRQSNNPEEIAKGEE